LAVDRDFERNKLAWVVTEQFWRIRDKPKSFDVMSLVDHLDAAHRQLAGVTEHLCTELPTQQRTQIWRSNLFLHRRFRFRLYLSPCRRAPYQFEQSVECCFGLAVAVEQAGPPSRRFQELS